MNNKKIQLFLLPFAGGNATSFNRLTELLDDRIEAICVEYLGRLSRRKEKFITEYEDFLNDTANYINARRNGLPVSILGYSLGSVLAFDLITKEMINGEPIYCFICARGDLKDKSISQRYHELPDAEFTQKMIGLGGFDQRILDNKRFLEIHMKPVRMDYIVWSKYQYKDEGLKIPCGMTVIYSPQDPLSANAHGWEGLTDGNIDFYELGDNHFFISQRYKEMADIINCHLKRYL